MIQDIIHRMGKLPTLPGIAMEILEAVQREEPNLKEIGDILATDPPLSVEVLKIINSPFYGLPKKITSVFHAVNMLGINTVKNLALSFSLIKSFHLDDTHGFDFTNFWKDSLIGAVSAKLITRRVRPELSEDAFFLGLIHNIGILTLAWCMPKQYSLVTQKTTNENYLHHEAESQILGFNHMQVGEYLIKSWGLPGTFHAPVGRHHHPEETPPGDSEIELFTRVLHLSSLYIDLFQSPDMNVLDLKMIEHHAENYGFQGKFIVEEIGMRIHEQTQQIFPIFEIHFEKQNAYIEMLETAREELIHLSTNILDKFMDQKRQIETLRKQVTRDGMTGLINYNRFHELLREEVYRSRRYGLPLTVIFSDIDHFKSINDKYGHVAGDQALKTVVHHMLQTVRESDKVARYGGEEFTIILPETAMTEAMQVSERLRRGVQDLEIRYEEKTFSLTMSFGLASLPTNKKISGEDLVKLADDALYKAKTSGRNRCCTLPGYTP
ncbi:MAG: GGDEF domain-containing protein [Desulfobacterales bacterium]|nr:GGDEF domain-containing protein [Desulfobacterales bacterium]